MSVDDTDELSLPQRSPAGVSHKGHEGHKEVKLRTRHRCFRTIPPGNRLTVSRFCRCVFLFVSFVPFVVPCSGPAKDRRPPLSRLIAVSVCRAPSATARIGAWIASLVQKPLPSAFQSRRFAFVTVPLDTLSGDSSRVMVALGPRSYEIVIATGRLHDLGVVAKDLADAGLGRGGRLRPVRPSSSATATSPARMPRRPPTACGRPVGKSAALIWNRANRPSRSPVVSQLYDALVDLKADRRTLVVAVGGGVVGDSAGFAAATYARGIPFVQIPTTLLAHVDSSVGGKVGINHPQGKNLIGAFHQPLGVFIDTATLDTLPDRDYRSGLAEVVKYGVILDGEFFAYLEAHIEELNRRDPDVLRHVIARSCRLKADVVEQDEHEITGLRAVLNYGHTFAHAYEALTGYGELMHGEAVAIGMIHASRLAERLGRIDASITERQIALLEALHLPTSLPAGRRLPGRRGDRSHAARQKDAVAGRSVSSCRSRMGHVELVDKVACRESPRRARRRPVTADVRFEDRSPTRRVELLWMRFGSTWSRGSGRDCSKSLLEAFGSPAGILAASVQELQQVDGIGPKLSDSNRRPPRSGRPPSASSSGAGKPACGCS